MLRIPFVLIVNLFRFLKFLFVFVLFRFFSLFTPSSQYVQIRITNDFTFGASKRMKWFKHVPNLLDLRDELDTIKTDPKIAGIVFEIEAYTLSSFLVAELEEEIQKLREAGKKTVARADMLTLKTLTLAAACDDVVMAPSGRIYPFGGRIESTFLRNIFEKAGISAQFIHIGEFKAAANRYIRNDMSPSQKTMMQSLLDTMEDGALSKLSNYRDIAREEISTRLAGGPLDTRQAIQRGLIDGEAFASDISVWLEEGPKMAQIVPEPREEKTGKSKKKKTKKTEKEHIEIIEFDEYSGPPTLELLPLFRPRKIALLDLSGVIVGPGMHQRGATVNSEHVVPALRKLANNRRVSSVILHINSPGGSALASDIMWNEIEKLRAKKPVVALCSDVAASGGYYLAVASETIVCRKETITGSIGVITGKLSGGALAEKIGLGVDTITNDESSAFMSLYSSLPDDLLKNFRDEARTFYRRFLERVGMAREIAPRRLHRYGRGRVYMGAQAAERNLVDRLDGLDGAIEEAQNLLSKKPKKLDIEFISTEKFTLRSLLSDSPLASLRILGKVEEKLDLLELFQRSKTLALMPFSIREE